MVYQKEFAQRQIYIILRNSLFLELDIVSCRSLDTLHFGCKKRFEISPTKFYHPHSLGAHCPCHCARSPVEAGKAEIVCLCIFYKALQASEMFRKKCFRPQGSATPFCYSVLRASWKK